MMDSLMNYPERMADVRHVSAILNGCAQGDGRTQASALAFLDEYDPEEGWAE